MGISSAPLKSIELFAGIGGFRIACDQLGFETIWSNEINELSSKVYTHNFGEKGHVNGDINQELDNIPAHDVLTAGFPCQPFSSAGKKLGIGDTRGTLFEAIVKILDKHRPQYFVLENVKRLLSMDKGKHFATILDALSELDYLIEWRLVDAAALGVPQSRERIVITGRLNEKSNLSNLCSEEDFNSLPHKATSKICNESGWSPISEHTQRFWSWGMARKGSFCHAEVEHFSEKKDYIGIIDVLEKEPDKSFFFTEDTIKRIQESTYVNRVVNGVRILYNQKGGARMGYTIFGVDGIAPTLTCTTSRHYERYKIGDEYRRLTPIEYARIQGFPDQHCCIAKKYDQYGLYGNAVPPPLAKWALETTTMGKSVKTSDLNFQLSML